MNIKTYIIDASGRVLGRLATEIAILLRGKHKTNFVPYLDMGDEVIVINTSGIKIRGEKNEQKKYYRHTGYLGGIKKISYRELFKKNPNEVLKRAVYGMLPKNKLRAKMIKRLKLYKESQHDKD